MRKKQVSGYHFPQVRGSWFSLGRIALSADVNDALDHGRNMLDFYKFVEECLNRHAAKDWGDLWDSAYKRNDEALARLQSVNSVYYIPARRCPKQSGRLLCIKTNAWRTETTVSFYGEE